MILIHNLTCGFQREFILPKHRNQPQSNETKSSSSLNQSREDLRAHEDDEEEIDIGDDNDDDFIMNKGQSSTFVDDAWEPHSLYAELHHHLISANCSRTS